MAEFLEKEKIKKLVNCVILANHAGGALDAVIAAAVLQHADNVTVLVNEILKNLFPKIIDSVFVNVFGKKNLNLNKKIGAAVQKKYPFIIFPGGLVRNEEKNWPEKLFQFLKKNPELSIIFCSTRGFKIFEPLKTTIKIFDFLHENLQKIGINSPHVQKSITTLFLGGNAAKNIEKKISVNIKFGKIEIDKIDSVDQLLEKFQEFQKFHDNY